MCLAIPMQVDEINGFLARCSTKGVSRDVICSFCKTASSDRRLRTRAFWATPLRSSMWRRLSCIGKRSTPIGRDGWTRRCMSYRYAWALLDEVARIARAADARAVHSVTVRIGPLSGVELDC